MPVVNGMAVLVPPIHAASRTLVGLESESTEMSSIGATREAAQPAGTRFGADQGAMTRP
jgi:hypothetical protein